MSKLEAKIQEIKQRGAHYSAGSVSVNEFGELQQRVSLLDARIVEGYAIIWGSKNLHGEIFVKGCCAKSIRERGPGSGSNYEIKFLNQHNQDDPLALFEELREDDIGLYFRTKPLDDVASADRLLKQIRSGTINNFSHGWDYVWERMEWDDVNEAILIKEISLFEISAVSIPSGLSTYAIRSFSNTAELYDEIEDFIEELPRKFHIKARQFFSIALHTSPSDFAPPETSSRAPEERTPKHEKRAVDYQYLINNLKN